MAESISAELILLDERSADRIAAQRGMRITSTVAGHQSLAGPAPLKLQRRGEAAKRRRGESRSRKPRRYRSHSADHGEQPIADLMAGSDHLVRIAFDRAYSPKSASTVQSSAARIWRGLNPPSSTPPDASSIVIYEVAPVNRLLHPQSIAGSRRPDTSLLVHRSNDHDGHRMSRLTRRCTARRRSRT